MLWRKASEIMKKDLVTVRPETQIKELATLLDEENIQGVPVVNPLGVPIGVVSRTDVVRYLAEQEGPGINAPNPFYRAFDENYDFGEHWPPREDIADLLVSVKKIMSSQVITAPESASAGALASLMLKEGVHRVLITRNEKLVGIVTAFDLLQCVAEQERLGLVSSGVTPIEAKAPSTKRKKP